MGTGGGCLLFGTPTKQTPLTVLILSDICFGETSTNEHLNNSGDWNLDSLELPIVACESTEVLAVDRKRHRSSHFKVTSGRPNRLRVCMMQGNKKMVFTQHVRIRLSLKGPLADILGLVRERLELADFSVPPICLVVRASA